MVHDQLVFGDPCSGRRLPCRTRRWQAVRDAASRWSAGWAARPRAGRPAPTGRGLIGVAVLVRDAGGGLAIGLARSRRSASPRFFVILAPEGPSCRRATSSRSISACCSPRRSACRRSTCPRSRASARAAASAPRSAHWPCRSRAACSVALADRPDRAARHRDPGVDRHPGARSTPNCSSRRSPTIAAQLGRRCARGDGLPPSQDISSHPAVIVPHDPACAQAVAQLGLPLTDVAYSYPTFLPREPRRPGPARSSTTTAATTHPADPRDKLLEISRPTTIGAVPLCPDPGRSCRRMWVLRSRTLTSP